jgi:hypothetical protein
MVIFAPFYELFEQVFGIFDNQFSMVFQTFFEKGGYNNMGMLLLFIPLIFLLLFYLLWKFPYGNFWHWLIYLGVIALIVGASTFGSVRLTLAKFLVDSNPLIADFTGNLVLKYAILNACLSLIISFIYSLILSRFSKVQMHLPF